MTYKASSQRCIDADLFVNKKSSKKETSGELNYQDALLQQCPSSEVV